MARISKSLALKGCVISHDEDGKYTVTEFTKDDSTDYSLDELLKEWLEVDSVSITIKRDVILGEE